MSYLLKRPISLPISNCVNLSFTGYTRHHTNHAFQAKENVAVYSGSLEQSSTSTTPSPLARLPTSSILRSLMLGSFFTIPMLFTPGLACMKKIATCPPSSFLSPDRNPFLKALIKPLVYDQFCAGTNRSEIQRTKARIKALGFSGVVLCYGRETRAGGSGGRQATEVGFAQESQDQEVDQWKKGNMETLDIAGEGDWLGIKFTGAGKKITEALMEGSDPSKQFLAAMDAIAQKAASQNCRIWIDAEQQVLQQSIDRWTIDLMRRYNINGRVVIYNTLQAYLKASRPKLESQLRLAKEEGWTLAVKLVRGAYIGSDIRERIHDTKAETDTSYDSIVRDLLRGSFNDLSKDDFPKLALFLAGHNPASITKATDLIQQLSTRGELQLLPDFGQLQGMADGLGCKLLQHGEEVIKQSRQTQTTAVVPKVYKCLTWGSVQECMEYLVRRAVENRGGTEAMKLEMPVLMKELRRRIVDKAMWRRSTPA